MPDIRPKTVFYRYEFPLELIDGHVVEVNLYDKDKSSSDEFLGYAAIGTITCDPRISKTAMLQLLFFHMVVKYFDSFPSGGLNVVKLGVVTYFVSILQQ